MALQRLEKPTATFTKGIITDAPFLAFPEDASVDEQNFELLMDGSRRRRKGLALETNGVAITLATASTNAINSFKWANVSSVADTDLIVIQIGSKLYMFSDTSPVSNSPVFQLDLLTFKVTSASSANVASTPVDLASGRGQLIVVGKYIKPFYVKEDGGVYTAVNITLQERDFQGLEDESTPGEQPPTLTSAHDYNLKNAGWSAADIATYFSGQSKYPSLNMDSYLGYRRTIVAGIAESDGTLGFSSSKLVAEVFGDSPAPRGHYLRDPFYTFATTSSDTVYWYTSTNSYNDSTGAVTLNFSAAHGLSGGDTLVVTSGTVTYTVPASLSYVDGYGNPVFSDPYDVVVDLAGTTLTVTSVTDADTAVFSGVASGYTSGVLSDVVLADTSAPLGAASSPYRPTATAFFAGRVWYAGTPYLDLNSKILFTQILEADAQYGKCYQQADPTDPNISELVDTDGGALIIPEMENVKRMVPYGSSLLVFCSNGIWQIGPGGNGYFTATSYSIRKITDIGCASATSVVVAEGTPMYWGNEAIYTLTQDPNTGYLVVTPVSTGKIDTLYAAIPRTCKANACKGTYDPVNKRILWFYNSSGSNTQRLNTVLVFDLRFEAFTKWVLSEAASAYAVTAFTLKASTGVESETVKVVGLTGTNTTVTIGQFINTTAYTDWGLSATDAYIVTGYDTAGAMTHFKQTPIITVFMKRTETGFTDLENGDYLPIGESSLTMQARWNWTDNTITGKWGTAQQVYRHQRMFTPSTTASYDDGYPVVVTRNRVRGRGRSLHLKFTAGAGKNAHLLGWGTNYAVLTDN